MDAARHRELTGADNRTILDNLLRLDAAGAKTWLRFPLAPGLNDSPEDIAALRSFVAGLRNVEKTEICPYHPLGLEKYVKFGRKVLYDNPEYASAKDVARWEAALRGFA
jgi:pyruvate formate lyase activating enzyme